MITLYHGATEVIDKPLANFGRAGLDFGQGFYLTKNEEQARNWAIRMNAVRRYNAAIVNVYELDTACMSAFSTLTFDEYNLDWLEFVVGSRKGKKPWTGYDIVEGGVASDKVINTVELYLDGVITKKQALGRLKYEKPNHQMCFLNQEVIDRFLFFRGYYLVEK